MLLLSVQPAEPVFTCNAKSARLCQLQQKRFIALVPVGGEMPFVEIPLPKAFDFCRQVEPPFEQWERQFVQLWRWLVNESKERKWTRWWHLQVLWNGKVIFRIMAFLDGLSGLVDSVHTLFKITFSQTPEANLTKALQSLITSHESYLTRKLTI